MALSNATADVCAQAIVTALGLTGDQATEALVKWKQTIRAVYSSLKTDIQIAVTVTSVSAVTPGGGVSGPGAGTGTAL